jgi:tetratricopeptide (TPR) repeat protein
MSTIEQPGPAPPRRRRRWVRWGFSAAALGLLAAWLGCEGWALWHERAARRAVADEDFDGARAHVDRALRVHGGRAGTHLLAARIERYRGDFASAERHLVRCKEAGGVTEALQLEWMLLRCERGDVDALAPAMLEAVARDDPASADILEALARVYLTQTRYYDGLDVLNKWLARVPDSPRALDWRGWVHNQLDHRGEAIDDYQRALELRPGRASVRLRLAQILIESSRHSEALPHLERLWAEGEKAPDAAVALAACRLVQGRLEDARQLLEAVLAAHPDHFGALRQLGNLEREAGRYAESERLLRRALDRRPLDPVARYSLFLTLQAQPERRAEAEQERQRWERDRQVTLRATELIRAGLRTRPNDPDLAAEAGELLLRLGEDHRGLFWLNRALSVDPAHAAAHRALAAYYERTNDPARAERHRRFVPAPQQPK